MAITRQELYEKIWKGPLKQVAEELGTNYVELVRACESLNAPRPPQSHCQRLKRGLPIESVPQYGMIEIENADGLRKVQPS